MFKSFLHGIWTLSLEKIWIWLSTPSERGIDFTLTIKEPKKNPNDSRRKTKS